MRRKWGAFAWPNGRSRPRGCRRRGRGIRFYIRCAASGSRPASSSTAGSKKLGFWIFMRHKTRKLGGVRLDEREVEAASRRVAEDGEFVFVYGVRRIWFASCVGFDRGIEKTLGFWCKMNINEARNNWGGVRLAEREIEAASRWVQRTEEFVFVSGAPRLVRVRRRVRPRDRKNWVFEYSWGTKHENLGAFVWTNGRSRPRADGCRGRRISFCIRCAAFGSRPASGSTAGSEKTWVFGAKWILMRYEIIGGRSFGRTGDRGHEPAGADDGRIRFCIRCAAFGSRPTSGSTAGSKKLGFWCKMNIHEARKLGSVRFGRTGGRGHEPAGAEDGQIVFVSGAPHLVRVRRRVRPPDRKNWVLVQNEYSYADE